MEPDFFSLLILMVVIWTAGRLFQVLHLPIVFGEIVGGIIVGPTLLNIVDPETEIIRVLSELGIFFLMLHAGLKTDHQELTSCSKQSFLVAIGGIIPTLLGGYWLSTAFGYSLSESVFIALSLSISAIAVAARIFKDTGLEKSRIAHVTYGAAIVTDIVGLILFALALNIADEGAINVYELLLLLGKVAFFFGFVILLGLKLSPYLSRVLYKGNKGFTFALIIALAIGYLGEVMGLHIIIGAFLAGLFIREEFVDHKVFEKIEDRVYGLSYSFFGPIFFASLAFYLDFSAITEAPIFLLGIIAIAILGKLIGSYVTAKLAGLSSQESSLIGLSMNNRGAVEMVIATIGFEHGIIDGTVFSILVLMAFCTTLLSILGTAPLARRLT